MENIAEIRLNADGLESLVSIQRNRGLLDYLEIATSRAVAI